MSKVQKTQPNKNVVIMVCSSFFFSSLAFGLMGAIFAGLSQIFELNANVYNIILPLNTILLLLISSLAMITIICRQQVWFTLCIISMFIILTLSSSLLLSVTNINFKMPLIQLCSWLLLSIGLLGYYKKGQAGWNKLSLMCFTVLALAMLLLLCLNTGSIEHVLFSSSPSASLNTIIFMLFSAIAGLTIPAVLRFNFRLRMPSLGAILASLLTFFSLLLWLNFMHQLELGNQKVVKDIVQKFQQQTEQILQVQQGLMQRLSERLSTSQFEYLSVQLELDIKSYLRDFNYLDYISVVDNVGDINYSAAQNNPTQQWYDHYILTHQSLVVDRIDEKSKVSFYYDHKEDHTFIRMPLTQPNKLGLSSVIAGMNFQKSLKSAIPVIVPLGYAVTLTNGDFSELLLNQLSPEQQYFRLGSYDINVSDEILWHLEVYRNFDAELNFVRQISEIILLVGWFSCFLALLLGHYQHQMLSQQKRLISGNQRLKESFEAQNKLQINHLQFMGNSVDILCIVDEQGRFVEISDSCKTILGYTVEELVGRLFMDLVHPEDHAITTEEAEKLTAAQVTEYFRNRYVGKSGKIVHLMWSASYVPSIQTMYAVARDISGLVKAEYFRQSQQDILNLISNEEPIAEILEQICLIAEADNPTLKASIMLRNDRQLHIAAAPSLSRASHDALRAITVADNVGSCGAAVYRNNLVISDDIALDPHWQDFKDVILAEDLHACWSKPLAMRDNIVTGTIAFYCQQARAPQIEELELLASCCRLASLALERAQQKQLLTESEQRYRSLSQYNPDPVYVLDVAGYFTEINQAGCALLGCSLAELKQMHFTRVLADEKLDEVTEHFIRVLAGCAESFETSIVSRSGKQHEMQMTIIPTWIDGKVAGVIGIAKDITQRLQTEKQLRLFKRAVDASSNGVIITDITQPDMPISYVNNGFEKLTGYSQVEVLGKNCRFLQGADQDELVTGQIRMAIQAEQEVRVVLKNYRKDGGAFWNNLFLAPVPGEDGLITHYIGIQTDITEQKQYEQELAFNASHDLLTGLPNRGLLQDRLSQSLKVTARHPNKVAILFIDLDGFKLINDSLGHSVGDEVICQVSRLIKKQVRPGDTLARMGGDEFVLMLPDINDKSEVDSTTHRILNAIAVPFEVNGRVFQVTASIGISIADAAMAEPMQLVQQADLAMYKAKQSGRNNAQWYNTDMETTLHKHLNLKAMLKKAVVNQEFQLHYQPQIDAGSGRIIGLEALIRWYHPEIGYIRPDEFIAVAEETGLIIEIGQWVIEQAAKYNRSLQERGLIHLTMAVNLSSIQFQRANFVDELKKTLDNIQLDPKWFELELTESLLLEDIEQVVYKLQQLKQLGFSIAIDDFGTGYSSLNYLKRLPIDKIKIDRNFIRDVVTDQKDAAITRAIIAMAHQLGIKVVAEGIETQAQATLLEKNLCNELQGYFFSKPLPAEKLEIYLENFLPTKSLLVNTEQQNLLLVDDEENILYALRRVLRKESFNIITCNSAAEAFELLAMHDIQVIVSDQRMPETNGTEFLSRVKDMYPETIRLVLSGYTDLRTVTDAINHGAIYKFITKPWQDDNIKEEIQAAFRLYKQQHIKRQ